MIFGVHVRVWLGLALLTGSPIHAANPSHRLKSWEVGSGADGDGRHGHMIADGHSDHGAVVVEFGAEGDVDVVSGQQQEATAQNEPPIMRAEPLKNDEASLLATAASEAHSSPAAAMRSERPDRKTDETSHMAIAAAELHSTPAAAMRSEPPERKKDEASHVVTATSDLHSAPAAAFVAQGARPQSHTMNGIPDFTPSKSAAGPHEEHALPPWAQILITSTLMLMMMSIWWAVRAMLSSPVPRGADSERLAAVLQEALAKVQSLEEQLETRQEVDAMFVDSDDEDDGGSQSSTQRAARDAERRTREIHESAARMAEQTQRLSQGANRAHDEFARGVDKAREVLQDCAEKETSGLFTDVKDAVNQNQATIAKWEPPDWMTEEGHIQLPPLMQLISGAAANSQIRAIRFFNSGCISLGFLMLTLSVVTFVLDWKRKCIDYSIWVWHIGLLSITTLDTFCRILIVRNATKSLDFLKKGRIELDKEDTEKAGGGGIFEMFGSFSRRSNKFFDAFFKYYTLTDSWSYSFASFLSSMSLLWGAAGLFISIHDILEDTLACKARIALLYMHVYSFVYVMLLTWNIIGVAFWLLSFISGSSIVRTPLIKVAKACDDDMMKGMPIVLSLVQSFVLKDSSEVYSLKTRQILKEIHEIEEIERELREKLSERKINRVRLRELESEVKSEEEFMTRSQDRVRRGLDELKPLVGLLAAQVTTNQGPQGDPTAGGSSSAPHRHAPMHFTDDEEGRAARDRYDDVEHF